MSELRDLAEVLRAIQKSLKDLGEHVAAQDANGEQLRRSLHDLNNSVMARDGAIDEHFEKANTWMEKFDIAQKGLSDAITNLQSSLAAHRREIGKRIRKYEDKEEVTSPGIKLNDR
jgi:uncharacterized protein YukE